ncbi:fimbrillin family protein [Phocaeicola sp.]|uniref:fimbrillin family protein n=1 Tax=Phocaeicola sp. TaxID=2773926 RepID=UPI003A8E7A6A
MIRSGFFNVVFLLFVVAGSMSCQQNDDIETEYTQISFHSYVDGKESPGYLSRGEIHENTTLNSRGKLIYTSSMYSSFGCWASTYGITETWNEGSPINLMNNREIRQSASYISNAYWPGAQQKVKFFAYAPYGSAAISLLGNMNGYPTFDYTTPSEIVNQEDVLVASTMEYAGNFNKDVPLNFKHALTVIKFIDMGLPQGTVTKITLSGVYGKARHYVGKNVWDNHAELKDFVLQTNYKTSTVENSGTEIVDSNGNFIMIPQRLSEGAKLKIELQEINGSTQEYTVSLANTEWIMGKMIKYNLSIDNKALIVVGDLTDWQDGGDL